MIRAALCALAVWASAAQAEGCRDLTHEGLIPESICESYESVWRSVFQSPKMLEWLSKNEQNLARELGEQIRKLVAVPQET